MEFFKIRSSVLLGLAVILWSCQSPKPADGFLIEGELKNYQFESILKLNGMADAPDTIPVTNGKFMYTGKVDNAERISFQTADPDSWDMFSVWVDNSEISVVVDFTKPEEKEGRLVINGSAAQNLADQFSKLIKSESEDRNAQLAMLAKENANNPVTLASITSACATLTSGTADLPTLKVYMTILKTPFGETKEYKALQDLADFTEKRKPGVQFIDYTAKGTKGEDIRLANMLGEGYVFVDCWASWCGPCRAENPYIKEAVALYEKQGFKVLSVSFDSRQNLWKKAIDDDDIYQFTHASELNAFKNQIAQAYGIKGIPDNFLLDKEGKIVANNLKGHQLLEYLKELHERS